MHPPPRRVVSTFYATTFVSPGGSITPPVPCEAPLALRAPAPHAPRWQCPHASRMAGGIFYGSAVWDPALIIAQVRVCAARAGALR